LYWINYACEQSIKYNRPIVTIYAGKDIIPNTRGEVFSGHLGRLLRKQFTKSKQEVINHLEYSKTVIRASEDDGLFAFIATNLENYVALWNALEQRGEVWTYYQVSRNTIHGINKKLVAYGKKNRG